MNYETYSSKKFLSLLAYEFLRLKLLSVGFLLLRIFLEGDLAVKVVISTVPPSLEFGEYRPSSGDLSLPMRHKF